MSNEERGGHFYDDIPDEYYATEDDALAHAFSLDHLDLPIDYMNDEEAYYMASDMDPLDELIAEEDLDAWELSNESGTS